MDLVGQELGAWYIQGIRKIAGKLLETFIVETVVMSRDMSGCNVT